MVINKFTKGKNGQYKIELDNDEIIIVHEDLILKYDLLLTKKLSSEVFNKILEENVTSIAIDKAMRYISIRMRSIKELEEYLLKSAIDSSIIKNVIDQLANKGYLNDIEYCKTFIQDKIHLSNDGPYKIAKELEKKGIEEEIIWRNLNLFEKDIQIEKIKKIIHKMKSLNRNKSAMMLKNKIVIYLVNLGYEKSLVISLLEQQGIENDDEIAKREYDKLYKKLSRKYEGNELEYKIKEKMYKLGFSHSHFDL